MSGLLISNLVIFQVSLVLTSSCPDLLYTKEKDGKTRLTTIHTGNYTIQGLMTLSTPNSNCRVVSPDGVVRSYAIKYAIDRANENKNLTRWAKLGLQLDDVCQNLPVTMARAIEIVSLHRPNSVCRADFLKCDRFVDTTSVREATAVIGTQMSFTSIPLASLMSLYHIPQVSYAASSRLLSKTDLYKSFFRTIPSDTNQVLVMLDIFKKFNWNFVFAIGSDDDYGKLGVSDLKKKAKPSNICITHDEYIPFQSVKTQPRIRSVIEKVKNWKKAVVVVLFCYVNGLGDLILEEAKRQGVKRIWLTSEAWNPSALTLNKALRNQTEGILSVSLKSQSLGYFTTYMEDEIKNKWSCNMWLKNYLRNSKFNCEPTGISTNKTSFTGNGCEVSVQDVVEKLRDSLGRIDNLIDAVTAVSIAVTKLLEKQCRNKSSCSVPKLNMKQLTEEMFNVSFVNQQGMEISFDSKGDPKFAFYTIENLQIVNGNLQYVPVGSWSQKGREGDRLALSTDKIKWPLWFAPSKQQRFPSSRCSEECVPGQAVVGQTDCCWGCQDCTGNNYTSIKMAEACVSCGHYQHTDVKHTRCIVTPILWLEISDPAGMSIVVISGIGIVITIVACVILIKLRHLVRVNEPAPHLITVSCVLLILTFVYGPLHITEPEHVLCQVRNSVFFALLMTYASVLLVKSKFMIRYLQKQAKKYIRGNLLVTQLLFLFTMLLIELASVVAWLYIDKVQVQEFRQAGVHEIWKQCEVSFTAARLVSTFIPCIVLIIATFCAFRERNLEHSFYEPKFLSFTCIALCIIIVAFLPTFKYVVGIYKAIVMAFTMDVFGYTFMACLVLPKVYVALVRLKRGVDEYPIKPGSSNRKKKKDSVCSKSNRTASVGNKTDTTAVDGEGHTSCNSEPGDFDSAERKVTNESVNEKYEQGSYVDIRSACGFVEDDERLSGHHNNTKL
ncbi:extracellular calcium-sensing receptor-like [Hydractinia symbiolongicarpus]|uniref:extracellular calcium-sensing receptor-like n=1 Tax=Hydractinia symbiolongicarpus TaxID=13093 RepID=UPI002550C413|nr:extracellular calcium-sensing receptor-like [Hydractinia symbiolongicarpus]